MPSALRTHPPNHPSDHPVPQASVAIGFVTGILSGLEFQPERQRQLLKHAKLATSLLDDRVPATERIPLAHYIALYRLTVTELDDEAFGLLSRPLRPGCFEWLVRGALPAANLRGVLNRLCQLFSLLQDNFTLGLVEDSTGTSLQIQVRQPLPVNHGGYVFAHEWLLRLLHGLAAWLIAHPLPLDRASFPYAAPAHAIDYELLFASQIDFEAPSLMAHFPADWLRLPVQRSDADIAGFLRTAPASTTMLYRDDRQFAPRVRRLLRSALPAFLSLEETALRLNVSPRTLHRRLITEGCSYRMLREAMRRELAREWLSRGERSIAQIASDLGFADSTTFYRAFAAWEGCGPRAWQSGGKA